MITIRYDGEIVGQVFTDKRLTLEEALHLLNIDLSAEGTEPDLFEVTYGKR